MNVLRYKLRSYYVYLKSLFSWFPKSAKIQTHLQTPYFKTCLATVTNMPIGVRKMINHVTSLRKMKIAMKKPSIDAYTILPIHPSTAWALIWRKLLNWRHNVLSECVYVSFIVYPRGTPKRIEVMSQLSIHAFSSTVVSGPGWNFVSSPMARNGNTTKPALMRYKNLLKKRSKSVLGLRTKLLTRPTVPCTVAPS